MFEVGKVVVGSCEVDVDVEAGADVGGWGCRVMIEVVLSERIWL